MFGRDFERYFLIGLVEFFDILEEEDFFAGFLFEGKFRN